MNNAELSPNRSYESFRRSQQMNADIVTSPHNVRDALVAGTCMAGAVLELVNHSHEAFCKLITAVKISDKETIETIKSVYKKQNYLLDFHTAVGFTAAEIVGKKVMEQVIISTASPVKFAREIQKTTGIVIDDSEEIAKLKQKEKHVQIVKNEYPTVKEAIKKILQS